VHLKFEICFHSRKLSSHPSSLQHKLNFCFHDRIYISNVKCKVLARLGLAPWLPESSSSLSPLYLIFFLWTLYLPLIWNPTLPGGLTQWPADPGLGLGWVSFWTSYVADLMGQSMTRQTWVRLVEFFFDSKQSHL
jgi:hypothetical protein